MGVLAMICGWGIGRAARSGKHGVVPAGWFAWHCLFHHGLSLAPDSAKCLDRATRMVLRCLA